MQADHRVGIRSRQLKPPVPANVRTVIKGSGLEALRSITAKVDEAIVAFSKMSGEAGQTVNNRPDNFITSCWDRFEQTP
ncbi:MAG: hypothetical protein CL456_02935 [Acidimicrobiaceae bacterium]|nr:hypothetical protein [Acidimicrobiaceae bacterium]